MTCEGKTFPDGTYMACPLSLGEDCTCPQGVGVCLRVQEEFGAGTGEETE